MSECPFVTLLPREDGDYDVVRCERPAEHDDSHHTTDRRAEHRGPPWASLEWAYDPVGGVDETDDAGPKPGDNTVLGS
jgi:hypothetical protein